MGTRKKDARKIIILIYSLLIVLCILLLIKFSREIYSKSPVLQEEQKLEIEVWTIHGDIEKALNKSIEIYGEQFPELEFKVKVFKNEVYQSAVANAMVTDTLPDIFFCWGFQKLKDYVDSETILDITDYLSKRDIVQDMKPGVMDGFTFEQRQYAMPLYGWEATLYCNRKLFQENGLNYPTTFEELLDAISTFKQNGIIPLANGGKEAWLPSLYYMYLVLDTGTIEDVYEAAEDVSKFNTAPFIDAALKLEALIHTEPWQENYVEDDSYNAAYLFTQGKTAMLLTGSWVSSAIDGAYSKVRGNVDVIPFPNGNTSQGVGGYVDTYVVSKKSIMAQKEEYINLYLDLMQSIASISSKELGIGVPAYKNQSVNRYQFPTLYQCILNDKDIRYHPAYDQIFDGELTNKYYELLSDFLVGEISSKEFIEALSRESY